MSVFRPYCGWLRNPFHTNEACSIDVLELKCLISKVSLPMHTIVLFDELSCTESIDPICQLLVFYLFCTVA